MAKQPVRRRIVVSFTLEPDVKEAITIAAADGNVSASRFIEDLLIRTLGIKKKKVKT